MKFFNKKEKGIFLKNGDQLTFRTVKFQAIGETA